MIKFLCLFFALNLMIIGFAVVCIFTVLVAEKLFRKGKDK